jgi:general L-amino acid transport system substrate-binding protein
MRRRYIRSLVPVAVLALAASACSSDDDGGGGGGAAAEPTQAPTTTAGGGAETTAADATTADGTAAETTEDGATTTDGGAATTAGGATTTTGAAPGGAAPSGESLLDRVQSAGVVRCGVRDDLPGFSSLDASGEYVGFDADFCRVIAAAVLGDAEAVEFVPVETEARFTALQSGEIDVLSRNTTWTASRDGTEGATFLHPTYYDGQQMMVAADSGFESIDDMADTVVCVAGGTTSEGNVAGEFARRGLGVEVQSFENVDLLQEAFIAGRCDGWSSDGSQLAALRSAYPDGPEALVIFEEIFSKEPLTPAVIDGDSRWAQAVNWAILATITAEEFELTAENVEEGLNSENPNIVTFLGGPNADGQVVDPGLGLPADFAFQVVSQVGNYGEIFEEHLAPIGIERGLNALWNADPPGLQYAPPYR